MYAFRTYDARPANDRGRLRPEDILAANLLSLRLSASDVIPLFAKGEGAPQELLESMNAALSSLREARAFEEYESTNKLDLALTSLKRANEAARKVDGWTSVTVSKVLHRHVPRVVPIIDSRVRRFYGVNKQQDGKLYHQLWEDVRVNAGWLSELAGKYRTSDGRKLSILRVADILIWMRSVDPDAPTVDELTPETWDSAGLKASGWEGSLPLATLDASAVPRMPGVYVVLRESGVAPELLAERPHATARQASSYSESDLRLRWVSGAQVLYIGKAGTSLRNRLRQYRKFGEGTGINHAGGRSIWQLSDADNLTVAWHTLPANYDGLNASAAELGLIRAFREAHSELRPFANLVL
ncbi:DUF6308 family protein [Brachybacterium huguangmaarense]|uniref:DUF6308 family protein n=1 Tax=Brachybacterium huguangmaarense TaxID=1652028 RepID=A0ABY6G534_9MICO|nr:DUF6308 family protein [Brachybacterium huguangmaarense]UYG18222.1 DUF6308 family protein [Brachybacterium huguangmaarense]